MLLFSPAAHPQMKRGEPVRNTTPSRIALAVLVVSTPPLISGGLDVLREPRFPTEAHRKYPLASVSELVDGKWVGKAVPYQEPEFVTRMRGRFETFKSLEFPLPEEESDEVRYCRGKRHIHGVIPHGSEHGELSADRADKVHCSKFVYSNGRVKNVYYDPPNRPPELKWSVAYDDESRIVIVGSFYKGTITKIQACQYPLDGGAFDIRAPLSRKFTFSPKYGRISYRLYRDGEACTSVSSPYPTTVEPGKLPCQVLRYSKALRQVTADETLPMSEKVEAILHFTKLEPAENEEEVGWDINHSYGLLPDRAISRLGRLRAEHSFQALIVLLKERPSARQRREAAIAIARYADTRALMPLLRALEDEDSWARANDPPPNAWKASRCTCTWIVRAMFNICEIEADELIAEFLKSEDRFYGRDIQWTREWELAEDYPPWVASPVLAARGGGAASMDEKLVNILFSRVPPNSATLLELLGWLSERSEELDGEGVALVAHGIPRNTPLQKAASTIAGLLLSKESGQISLWQILRRLCLDETLVIRVESDRIIVASDAARSRASESTHASSDMLPAGDAQMMWRLTDTFTDHSRGARIGGTVPEGQEREIKDSETQYFGTFPLPGRTDLEFSIFHRFQTSGINNDRDVLDHMNQVLEPSDLIWATVHAPSERGSTTARPFPGRGFEVGPESPDRTPSPEQRDKLGGSCYLAPGKWQQSLVAELQRQGHRRVLQMHGCIAYDGYPWGPDMFHVWALDPSDPQTYRFMVEQDYSLRHKKPTFGP